MMRMTHKVGPPLTINDLRSAAFDPQALFYYDKTGHAWFHAKLVSVTAKMATVDISWQKGKRVRVASLRERWPL